MFMWLNFSCRYEHAEVQRNLVGLLLKATPYIYLMIYV